MVTTSGEVFGWNTESSANRAPLGIDDVLACTVSSVGPGFTVPYCTDTDGDRFGYPAALTPLTGLNMVIPVVPSDALYRRRSESIA